MSIVLYLKYLCTHHILLKSSSIWSTTSLITLQLRRLFKFILNDMTCVLYFFILKPTFENTAIFCTEFKKLDKVRFLIIIPLDGYPLPWKVLQCLDYFGKAMTILCSASSGTGASFKPIQEKDKTSSLLHSHKGIVTHFR